jgi:hypothetical protein
MNVTSGSCKIKTEFLLAPKFFFFPFFSLELFRLSCRETSLSCEARHAPFLATLSSQKLPMGEPAQEKIILEQGIRVRMRM